MSPERGDPQHRPHTGSGCTRTALLTLWQLARTVSTRFARDGCSLMAAASAYWGLLSLIPLGVLAISVFGRVLGSSQAAERQVLSLLEALLPVHAPDLEEAIRQFTYPSGRWFVEVLSLLGLLWAGSRLFWTLEDVLTRVWSGHGRGRPIFVRNLVALGATIAAGLIFLLTTGATTAASLAARIGAPSLPGLTWWGPYVHSLMPIVGAWVMFLLMYQFLPQEKVHWRAAMIGAGAAAVCWEVSRVAFARLVQESAGYGSLYGSLAGTVVLVIWLYLAAAIMLVGAEIAVVLQRHAEEQG